jgi:hypothetical protein
LGGVSKDTRVRPKAIVSSGECVVISCVVIDQGIVGSEIETKPQTRNQYSERRLRGCDGMRF